MESFKETRRQIQFALAGIGIILLIGTIGFVLLEGKTPLQAFYLTVITLTTVGYGDDYAVTDGGRLFTIFILLIGFGVVGYGLQATTTFLVSPAIREMRERRRIQRTCDQLERHYIICGHGDLVDQTISYLLKSAQMRLAYYDDQLYGPIDNFLDRLFGDDELGHYPKTRAAVREAYLTITRPFTRVGTLLDIIVVVTEDATYAKNLREEGFLVLEGSPTSDEALINAGIERATAIMVMLPDDTDALLTVLTARSHNQELFITAATIENELAEKTLRVGANNVIRPYELSGQFLNNVTLRPTVYDFFYGILFDQEYNTQTTQVTIDEGSHWVRKRVG
ncbi:MAG: potassium channel family protein, partial [Chloroflexota bacterium]